MNHSDKLDALEARLDKFAAKVAELRLHCAPLTVDDAIRLAQWECDIQGGREEIAFQRSRPDSDGPGQPPGGGR
jgi:hypothetical protein